jgi:hypothetical protein
MTDIYGHWRAAQSGGSGPYLPTYHDNDHAENPQPGLYKLRPAKGADHVLAQIWLIDVNCGVAHKWADGLKLAGVIDGKPATPDQIADRWMWMKAVSKADAAHYKATGNWPGDVPEAAPSIGHNVKELSLAEQISEYAHMALGWLTTTGIKDKTSADMAGNYRAKLLDFKKQADSAREDQVRPHLDAQREINAEFKPLIAEAEAAANQIRDALTVWMRAEQVRLEAEQRAKYEAERKAAEAERARLAAEQAKRMTDDPIAALTDPDPAPEVVLPASPAPVKVNAGGQRGRAAGLRTVTRCVVTDHAAALAYFAGHEEVHALVVKLAEKALKAGAKVPGADLVKEQVAA